MQFQRFKSLCIQLRESAPLHHANALWLLLQESVIFWTGIAIIIWTYSSTFAQDILVYSAFAFALFHSSRGAGAWKQPAGIAFVVVLLYCLLALSFSVHFQLALRDYSGIVKLLAGMFAIPVIFCTRFRIQSALLFSATAITLTLGYDVGRLAWHLGPDLLAKAHAFKPFIFNHSNVASMMAGASTFILFYFFWIWRRRRWTALICLLGIAICLAYQIIVASRGPQLAFVLTVVCAGLLLPSWRRKTLWLAIVAIAASLVLTQAARINPRFVNQKSVVNFSERDKVWQHTWKLIQNRPWFGYGYGKRSFEAVYYKSQPPASSFHYPHCHEFWLKILFEFGWTGLILHLTAWSILAIQLLRHIYSRPTFEERLLPGTIGLILLCIHFYGLGDYPDNIVQMAQFWLIPLALMLIYVERTTEAGQTIQQTKRIMGNDQIDATEQPCHTGISGGAH